MLAEEEGKRTKKLAEFEVRAGSEGTGERGNRSGSSSSSSSSGGGSGGGGSGGGGGTERAKLFCAAIYKALDALAWVWLVGIAALTVSDAIENHPIEW